MSKTSKIAVIPHEEFEELKAELSEVKELLYNMCSGSGKKQDDWLNAKAAAKFLGVTTRTLQIWINKGIVKVSKIGRKLRFKRSDLEALLDRNTLNR